MQNASLEWSVCNKTYSLSTNDSVSEAREKWTHGEAKFVSFIPTIGLTSLIWGNIIAFFLHFIACFRNKVKIQGVQILITAIKCLLYKGN